MKGKNANQVTKASFTFSLDSGRNKSSQGFPFSGLWKVLAIVFGSLSHSYSIPPSKQISRPYRPLSSNNIVRVQQSNIRVPYISVPNPVRSIAQDLNTSLQRDPTHNGLTRNVHFNEEVIRGEEEEFLHPVLTGNLIGILRSPNSHLHLNPSASHLSPLSSSCHSSQKGSLLSWKQLCPSSVVQITGQSSSVTTQYPVSPIKHAGPRVVLQLCPKCHDQLNVSEVQLPHLAKADERRAYLAGWKVLSMVSVQHSFDS